MTLTKRDLVIRISNETGLVQQQVFGVVQKTLDYIAEALAKGDKVELRNFGVFEVKVRKARVGRNPNKPESARLLRVLRLFAARGAFLSLATWAGGGLTGDNTSAARFDAALVESLTVDLARHLASGGDEAEPFEHDTAARRAVVRWVFRVGLYDFARGLPNDMQAGARAHTISQARRRCRVLGSVIFGATFDEATRNAGFASLKTFAQSCKDAKLFEALREARAAAIENSGAVELAWVGAARWRITAGAAWRRLARLPSALDFTGTVSGRNVTHPAPKRGRSGRRAIMAARALARRHAVGAFNQAIEMRNYWRRVEQRARAANLRAFDLVFARRVADMREAGTAARFDSLLHVAGLRDSLGRVRGGGKRDSATITTARGKEARQRVDVGTLALRVGRCKRLLPCAQLAPAKDWQRAAHPDTFTVSGFFVSSHGVKPARRFVSCRVQHAERMADAATAPARD